jgi:uncharacterized membrane protein YkoI
VESEIPQHGIRLGSPDGMAGTTELQDGTMHRTKRQLVPLAAALLVAGMALAADRETLPTKVAQAIQAAYPAGRITKVECELRRGVAVYEVELRLDGQEIEVKVDETGVIGSTETELRLADAPEAVVSTCRNRSPGARIKEIERREIRAVFLFTGFALLKEPCVVYEVELRTKEGDVELLLDASGKALHAKSDADDDDDDDDDDD